MGKWLEGMCQKCLCCFKSKANMDTEHSEECQAVHVNNEPKLFEQFITNKLIDQFHLFESFIEDESEIINFQKKVDPSSEHLKDTEDQTIYMHIISEKNKEKRIYMLVKALQIRYEKNQHIMALVNFLQGPYQKPEKPHYVREAKFNNQRPFQMLIELTNSSISIFHKDFSDTKALILDVNMSFNLEKTGDPVKGPGKKTMVVDLLA